MSMCLHVCHLSIRPAHSHLAASLDEHAFRRRIPEVGPAPDMIEDDLPKNLDYLDDSFSATAGLKVLSDDDSDDFYPEDPDRVTDQTGVIGTYGGETIRLFDPEGLHIVEHHFDTLPPDSADESSQLVPSINLMQAGFEAFISGMAALH
jgi:autophagy-related protein 2